MIIDDFITRYMRYKTRQYFSLPGMTEACPPETPDGPVHLYIHIPFCSQLCPYCSFHRVLFHEQQAKVYFGALRKELGMYKERGFEFSSVYIGGGTPTILMDELLKTLLVIQEMFSPGEISVETNPDRLTRDILSSLASMGVKRVSVGIQTFDDDLLRAIGRYDKYGSAEQLKTRLIEAQGIVDTLNADMIFNFPAQDRGMLERDLDILEEIAPDQITFYPLMISDFTRTKMQSIMGMGEKGKERLFYSIISSRLEGSYEPASAWCFSRSPATSSPATSSPATKKMIDEYIVNSQEYVGIGSGAFGLVGSSIYTNTFSLEEYVTRIDQGLLPLSFQRQFSARELARYAFLMDLFGMRMDPRIFRERHGRGIWQMLGPETLFFMIIGGIRMDSGVLRLTDAGRYYWVIMMREFFIGVDNFRDYNRRAAGIDVE
ncbi:MAG: coproporphyrinogen III oxidase family protein [Thermodesulfobacteriota bacterium]|nr:coproporphyrinogen III oxidase family protein [Thermodesulfobacteriota bacterium]